MNSNTEHDTTRIVDPSTIASVKVSTLGTLSAVTAPVALPPGYEFVRELGRGGMGVVYLTRQQAANRAVALKMMQSGNFASKLDFERFRVEAQSAAKLDHSGIVQIFEVGEAESGPFYSMAYVEGDSLKGVFSGRRLSVRDLVVLMSDVAGAVGYAHDQGIVHRDLKPANILIDRQQRPRVMDFGLAKRLESPDELTLTGQLLGTPTYMSPEQAAGRHRLVDARSDIYALGAILYEGLTGRPPFIASSLSALLRQVQEDDPPPLQQFNPLVPRELQLICLKCLRKTPDERYASCREFAEDLQRYLEGEAISVQGSSWAGFVSRALRRSRDDVHLQSWSRILVGFAVIVAVAEMAVYLLHRGDSTLQLRLLGVRAVQFSAMLGLLWWQRDAWRQTPSNYTEQMWSLWIGFVIACHLAVINVHQTQRWLAPAEQVRIMACYPLFCILSGMMFITLGRTFWGVCYGFAAYFFAVSLLIPLHFSIAPLVFGASWSAVLGLLAWRLAGLQSDGDTANAHTVSDAQG